MFYSVKGPPVNSDAPMVPIRKTIEIKEFFEKINNYDFIRLTFADLNGLHLTKMVPARYAEKVATGKAEIYAGVTTFGPRNEITNIPEIVDCKHGNALLRADLSTLKPVPWAGHCHNAQHLAYKDSMKSFCSGNLPNKSSICPYMDSTQKAITTANKIPSLAKSARVCSLICDVAWSNGEVQAANPRFVAQKMLNRLLEKHNLIVYSAFEPEFRAFKPESVAPACVRPTVNDPQAGRSKTPKTFTEGEDMYKTGIHTKYEEFFFKADAYLQSVDIEVQDYSIENGEAQLETPLSPRYGLEAADMYFEFKQAIREIANECDIAISFMPNPLAGCSASGCHYNHSLWDVKTGKNAFYDPEDPDNLSEFAKHWIAGIVHHMPSILALCSPTVNCYRRLHRYLAPDYANWDIDDRFTSLRVKNQGVKGTYMENRIPSSASCPYHVMAATLAAGMDGVERKLRPPRAGLKPAIPPVIAGAVCWIPPKISSEEASTLVQLPFTLNEALVLLEADKNIIELLGKQFVSWFIQVKRRGDLFTLADVNINSETDESLAAERFEYLEYI